VRIDRINFEVHKSMKGEEEEEERVLSEVAG